MKLYPFKVFFIAESKLKLNPVLRIVSFQRVLVNSDFSV
jgi:hypothetical protein